MMLLQTLYIFGNGFDIAHGIRTPYSAFRDFLEKNHEPFLTTFESMYNIQPLDDTEPWYTKEAQERWNESVIHNLWWNFEKKIGHPDVWDMYDLAYSMVDTMPSEKIIDTMNAYWREQYGFVDKLQHYVLEWLQTIDASGVECKKDSLINNKNDLFMSFNYTDTLESAYGINYVFHPHGGVPSCCKTAPIMGHGNKYISVVPSFLSPKAILLPKIRNGLWKQDGRSWIYIIWNGIGDYPVIPNQIKSAIPISNKNTPI